MATATKSQDDDVKVGQRAPGAVTRPAARGADRRNEHGNEQFPSAEPDKPGMPAGYKPDKSATFVAGKPAGKDGSGGTPDQIKDADGTMTTVTPQNNNVPKALENLPPNHTYRDRVEAQAHSLGVPVVEGETLEYLLWKIRMMASS